MRDTGRLNLSPSCRQNVFVDLICLSNGCFPGIDLNLVPRCDSLASLLSFQDQVSSVVCVVDDYILVPFTMSLLCVRCPW